MRKAYLEVFELQYTTYKDDKTWWKKEFHNAGMIMLSSMEAAFEASTLDAGFTGLSAVVDKEIFIAYNEQLYVFKDRMVTVGRHPGCSVEFLQKSGTSRLHAVIYLLPEIEQYIVLDLGSCDGIITTNRSSEQPCLCSIPRARNLLSFHFDEVALLSMGVAKLAINPKSCIICFDRVRQQTFSCGHHLACSQCADRLSICPLCRKDISKTECKFEFNVKSMVGAATGGV